MQNSIVKVSKCFNIFYTIFTQVLDKIENFEFPRNAQCLLSASLKSTSGPTPLDHSTINCVNVSLASRSELSKAHTYETKHDINSK